MFNLWHKFVSTSRAHATGRFVWRNLLKKVDFAFSLVKIEVQVALHLLIEALCHLTIFATCNVLKGNDCLLISIWFIVYFDGTFIKSNPFRLKGTYYLLNFISSLIILHIHTFCKQSLDLSIQESCTFLVSWTKQVTLIL